ncbi:MAG: glycerol-3-phosphate acyltransferase [Chloroflexi bacterium]|nr:glycerol-3-phosphate acyltransferase [Chloroflexota bacterium]
MGAIVLIVGGYVLGALPFAVALAVANGIDPSDAGDLHIALWHRVGKLQAAAAAVVDFAKGVFPVLVGFGFSLPVVVVALSGVAAVVGQMWPPLRGHGEKGNSTGVGVLITLLLLYEAYLPLLCVAFFAVGAALRWMTLLSSSPERRSPGHPLSLALPLGMFLGFVAAPLLCWLTGQPQGLTWGLALMLCVIVARRLTAGLLVDMSVGARTSVILLRRLLFDQALAGRDW